MNNSHRCMNRECCNWNSERFRIFCCVIILTRLYFSIKHIRFSTAVSSWTAWWIKMWLQWIVNADSSSSFVRTQKNAMENGKTNTKDYTIIVLWNIAFNDWEIHAYRIWLHNLIRVLNIIFNARCHNRLRKILIKFYLFAYCFVWFVFPSLPYPISSMYWQWEHSTHSFVIPSYGSCAIFHFPVINDFASKMFHIFFITILTLAWIHLTNVPFAYFACMYVKRIFKLMGNGAIFIRRKRKWKKMRWKVNDNFEMAHKKWNKLFHTFFFLQHNIKF